MNMKINASKIIELRNGKAWSQQHLADVAGLSLRTVQRIENNGAGSPDSIKAIAMAFSLIPADLLETQVLSTNAPDSEQQDSRKTLLKVAACVAAVLVLGSPLTLLSETDKYTVKTQNEALPDNSAINTEQGQLLKEAALQWLSLVDDAEYILSWQECDPVVQTQVSAEQWQQAVQQARNMFGENKSRTIISMEFVNNLQGMPDGEYAMLVFNATFENKESSVETLPMSKASGTWKPIGYFIR